MQRSILKAVSAAALLAIAIGGCSEAPKLDGFIDKTGRLAIDLTKFTPPPQKVLDFSEGLCVIKQDADWSAIKTDGTVAFKKPFKTLTSFKESTAAYSVMVGKDERWGYVDKQGATQIKPAYSLAEPFSEGIAAVQTPATKKWSYVDTHGTPVMRESFESAGPFKEGIAAVKIGGKMGAVDRTGKLVVPARFDVVYPANSGTVVAAMGDGMSGAKAGQELSYFDKNGVLQFNKSIKPVALKNYKPMLWADADAKLAANQARSLSFFASPGFSENKSLSQIENKFSIDQQFDARAFAGTYDYIFPVTGGYFVAYDDKDGGKMDYRGGKPEAGDGIWDNKQFRFWDAAPFSDGMALVQPDKGGPYGYIDKTGKIILPAIYKQARSFNDGLALVGPHSLHND